MKRMLTALAHVIGFLILGLVGFLIYMTLTDYQPGEVEALATENTGAVLQINTAFSVMTFNIGYCGLDKEQDFFMDGGTGSRAVSREQVTANLQAVLGHLLNEKPDFILLQEVDTNSSRSYSVNEYDIIKKELSGYNSVFAVNYKVAWVPVPLVNPMGQVYSGLVTLSKYYTDSAVRYQYPGKEKWLRQLFELDRCFVESRISVENGKDLILINSHLSAFDEGGKIRKQQLEYLKKHLLEEAAKGNYIIAGGDWNHVLPGTDPASFETSESWPFWLQNLPGDFMSEGFRWAADPAVPTIRTTRHKYQEKINFAAAIDGFLVSENIKIINVQARQLFFENCDHNPVAGIFILQ